MRVDNFDFHLPESAIALEPARPRDSARLLHVKKDQYTDNNVVDLMTLLRPGDLLVVNDTKVLPVQLTGMRPAREINNDDSGRHNVSVDVTLHKNMSVDDATRQIWKAFVRPAKRIRQGDQLIFGSGLKAEVISREGAEATLKFFMNYHKFREGLLKVGAPPLPPYIARKRSLTEHDIDDYQTHFAVEEGSVAAPTAGLHFTNELLENLNAKGVGLETITLHVGAGTFLPVSVDDTKDHQMHSEWGEITLDQAARINKIKKNGGRIVAVGTTSLRLLESATDESGIVQPFCGDTDIFITPGYGFRAVDVLMTNFHLPKSTLFMLVCAFAGTDTMKASYAHAIEMGYRFYSYGDACLLERRLIV